MPDFATTCAMTAATRKILSATHTILALTWFCHLKSLGSMPKNHLPSNNETFFVAMMDKMKMKSK